MRARAWVVIAAVTSSFRCDCAPSSPQPTQLPSSAASPTTSSPSCRLVVNVAARDRGRLVREALLVSVAPTSASVERLPAWIARGQDHALYALHLVRESTPEASVREAVEVRSTPAQGGPSTLIASARSESIVPEADHHHGTWYADSDIVPLSIIGPYLAYDKPSSGYMGGTHEYDDSAIATIALPSGRPVPGEQLLDHSALRQANARISRDDRGRAPQGEPLPTLDRADRDFPGGAIALFGYHSPDDSARVVGLHYHTILECCSWAENRNHHRLYAPLEDVPAFYADHLERDEQGWLSPSGSCAQARVRRGRLEVRQRAHTRALTVELGNYLIDYPLGLVALAPGEALRPDEVPAQPGTGRSASALLRQGRAKAHAGRYDEAIALLKQAHLTAPRDATVLADLGWVEFRAHKLTDASRTSQQALNAARSDRRKGAILYNLGRIAEARGLPEEAKRYYDDSLKHRDNATVKARLKALATR